MHGIAGTDDFSERLADIVGRATNRGEITESDVQTVRRVADRLGQHWIDRVATLGEPGDTRCEPQDLAELAATWRLSRVAYAAAEKTARDYAARHGIALPAPPQPSAVREFLAAGSVRSLTCRADTADPRSRTVDAVLATESPVPMLDASRGEAVLEILRADGMTAVDQVPLLDCHRRQNVSDLIGSVRGIYRESGDTIAGTLHFASDDRSEQIFRKIQTGHATDVSAGYQVLEKTYVPAGKTLAVGGRSYSGPVNVVTAWRLREVSVVPIGADEQAKLRELAAV